MVSDASWSTQRERSLPRWGKRFGAALATLPVATGIGEAVDPMLGLFLGFPLVFIAMLVGLSYWAERFSGRRWFTRARRVEIRAGAQDYRGTQALDFRADGHRRLAKAIYVNTETRPGVDGRGVYAVLVDTEDGLVEVDAFDDVEVAGRLAERLRSRLGVDVTHASAGPARGSESTFDGWLSWFGMAAPVLAFLPSLLVAPNPAWVPTLAGLLFVFASFALDARVRTTRSTSAEEQFRARLRPTTRVRVDLSEDDELAESGRVSSRRRSARR
ncbi:MAG: hypothetical protein AB8I08_10080 [Sandaracinaceae bacterium]